MRSTPKRSIVWQYFKFKASSNNLVVCDICKKELKYSKNTSNLLDHLNRKHPTYMPSSSKTSDAENEKGNSQDDLNFVKDKNEYQKTKDKHQTKLLYFKKNEKLSEREQNSIDNILIKMIAVDCQPLSIVENIGFLEYTRKLQPLYVPPNRKLLSQKLIPEKYNLVVEKLQAILDEVSYVSITTDIWSSIACKSFLSVTCHFIYMEKLRSAILSTRELHSSHTSQNLSSELREIFDKWKISDKIVAVVSDNGQNIKKAVTDFLNKRHHPCVAHTLNLCVLDAMKGNEELNNLVAKCKKIVMHFKHSTKAAEKLREMQKQMGLSVLKVKQDVSTRWNSTYLMMQRLQDIKQPLSAVITSFTSAPEILNASEWQILQDCTTILKPANDLTIEISGEKYITMSLIIPLVRGTQKALLHLQPNSTCGELLKQSLIDTMHKRLGILESDKLCSKATLLDPRLKMAAFGVEQNATNAHHMLKNEIATLRNYEAGISTENSPLELETIGTSENEKTDNIWNFLDKNLIKAKECMTYSSSAEVELKQYITSQYIDRKENPLEFWKKNETTFPNLYKLHLKYLSVPATSVPSERLFSKAGQIMNDRRSLLRGAILDHLLFLNGNLELLD